MTDTVLPWQVAQWQHLQLALEEGRLGHALLLSGPPGIGKLRFARTLMRWLICEQAQAQGACGTCRNCGFGLEHPDMHIVEPPEGKKQIGVDQVRALVEVCSQTAHQAGGRKVILIHPADAMNPNTANALLKTLEEPSGSTVLILISDEPARLLPTIRSRCQHLNFPIPSRQLAIDWLKMTVPDTRQCEICLNEVNGRPLAAQVLFEEDGLAARQRCDEILRSWDANDQTLAQCYESLKEFDLEFLLDWYAQRLHALLRAVMSADSTALNDIWREWVNRSAKSILLQQQALLELRAQVQRGVAVNRQLTLESLLLNWQQPQSLAGLGL